MTASEIRRDWTGPIEKPGKRPKRDREGDDQAYRRTVKQLPCCVCFSPPPNDPHHLKRGTNDRGMGMRSSDRWAVPLCRFPARNNCHDKVEGAGNETEWFRRHGISDPLSMATRMWEAWQRERSLEAVSLALQPDDDDTVRYIKWKITTNRMTFQDISLARLLAGHGMLPGISFPQHGMVHVGQDPLADQYDYDDKDPLDQWRT